MHICIFWNSCAPPCACRPQYSTQCSWGFVVINVSRAVCYLFLVCKRCDVTSLYFYYVDTGSTIASLTLKKLLVMLRNILTSRVQSGHGPLAITTSPRRPRYQRCLDVGGVGMGSLMCRCCAHKAKGNHEEKRGEMPSLHRKHCDRTYTHKSECIKIDSNVARNTPQLVSDH